MIKGRGSGKCAFGIFSAYQSHNGDWGLETILFADQRGISAIYDRRLDIELLAKIALTVGMHHLYVFSPSTCVAFSTYIFLYFPHYFIPSGFNIIFSISLPVKMLSTVSKYVISLGTRIFC